MLVEKVQSHPESVIGGGGDEAIHWDVDTAETLVDMEASKR